MAFNSPFGGGRGGTGAGLTIDDAHWFADTTARDAAFDGSQPVNTYIAVDDGSGAYEYQRWDGSGWVDVTAIVRGPKGDPGDGTILSKENTTLSTIPAGTPVQANASGGIQPATSDAFGVLVDDCAPGFKGDVVIAGGVSVADWTVVAGTADLVPGSVYFMVHGGGLTRTPSMTPPQTHVQIIGHAVSTRILAVTIKQAIKI